MTQKTFTDTGYDETPRIKKIHDDLRAINSSFPLSVKEVNGKIQVIYNTTWSQTNYDVDMNHTYTNKSLTASQISQIDNYLTTNGLA